MLQITSRGIQTSSAETYVVSQEETGTPHPLHFTTSPKMISKHEDSIKRTNKFPLPKNSKYMAIT